MKIGRFGGIQWFIETRQSLCSPLWRRHHAHAERNAHSRGTANAPDASSASSGDAPATPTPGSRNLTIEDVRMQSASGVLALALDVRLSKDGKVRAQWGAPGTVLLQSSRSLPLTRHELALCHMRTRSIRS